MLDDLHILLCYDGSDQAIEAIDFAAAFFAADTRATVLYAWEPSPTAINGEWAPVAIPSDADQQAKRRARSLADAGATSGREARRGAAQDRASERPPHRLVVMTQKVAVIGVGAVGQACAFALILRGSAREIVLVDQSAKRAAGVASDMRYGAALSPTVQITSGELSDLDGAAVVLICAGVNEKSGGATNREDGRGRLRLLDTNAAIYRDIVPRVVAEAPDAVLVAVTDPPDPLADLTRALASHDRVLSTGTTIDTLRFRVHIAAELGVHPSSVEALVVGEHGTTEVMLWSSVRVAGTPLRAALDKQGALDGLRERVERQGGYANITIIEGNDP